MSDKQGHSRYHRGVSRPLESRENRDPESRPSYLRYYQEKERQDKDQIQMIFKDADSSIENILNNSMSHLDKVIEGMQSPMESFSIQDIYRQNTVLKGNLTKMKRMLKEKLEAGLEKQKRELTEVVGNYIELIAKLLQDKEDLTYALQQHQLHQCREEDYLAQMETLKEANKKMKHQLNEKDKQIKIDEEKLEEFLKAIEHYQEDDMREQEKMQAMVLRIQELEGRVKPKDSPSLSTSFSDKKDSQDAKIQTLLELLESREESNNNLELEIRSLQKSKKELKEGFQEKIRTIQSESEEEFMEYQKAVNETLYKKDECIERLNAVIESLKRK